MNNTIKSKYFFGNKISEYGIENGYVDYSTLAKSFNCVLNNDIMQVLEAKGFYFDLVNGDSVYYELNGNRYTEEEKEEKINEISDKIEELEELDTEEKEEEIKELYYMQEELEEEHYDDIYQYYIISENGYRILSEYTNEIVYYNEELDIYIWGITHYGTSWDYVLTDIKIDLDTE